MLPTLGHAIRNDLITGNTNHQHQFGPVFGPFQRENGPAAAALAISLYQQNPHRRNLPPTLDGRVTVLNPPQTDFFFIIIIKIFSSINFIFTFLFFAMN